MRREAGLLNEEQMKAREGNTLYHQREKIFSKLEEEEKQRLQQRLVRLRQTVGTV